ncbi:hypothetical protein BpHYR1_050840 [Brachionus plicatilis]|uniref:Uncharacterized protein n=1 Tax=Brachionus plicatilis TaxID=10195 RepID=A0A3M7PA31_BRAPC|nr:hypothetical protein BpHYR1_050840 [Brachionus plicatilis]
MSFKCFQYYELAIINSIQEVFPESEVCEYGLATKYSDFSSENLIRRHLKMLACFSFVLIDFAVDAFVELQGCIPNDLKKIFIYILNVLKFQEWNSYLYLYARVKNTSL